jgi:hypothetical protein
MPRFNCWRLPLETRFPSDYWPIRLLCVAGCKQPPNKPRSAFSTACRSASAQRATDRRGGNSYEDNGGLLLHDWLPTGGVGMESAISAARFKADDDLAVVGLRLSAGCVSRAAEVDEILSSGGSASEVRLSLHTAD